MFRVAHEVAVLVSSLLAIQRLRTALSFAPIDCFTPHHHYHHRHHYQQQPSTSASASSSTCCCYAHQKGQIPKGRVEDRDAWIQLSSDSLQKFTGKTLYEYMMIMHDDGDDDDNSSSNITTTPQQQVHDNERYAVLSHGIQDDPIYCYFNNAALQQFQWTEDEVYRLPSRYSAPDGADRNARQADIQQAIQEDFKELQSVVRQTKHGELFEMVNVLLWNVYDNVSDNGSLVRVGQTALYDRQLVRPIVVVDDPLSSAATTT